MTLKIGVGIPCSIRDVKMCMKYPIMTLSKMKPRPDKILVNVNDRGYSGLKEVRIGIFDRLFLEYDCDIALSVCSDYLFTNMNLMKEIHPTKVMNYGRFFNTPIMGLMHYVARRLVDKPWSSMYSIPKDIWFDKVRDNPLYNGTDSSVSHCVDLDFEAHMGINYILMRRNTKRIIHNALFNPYMRDKHIIKRILKLTQGLPI